MNRRELLYPAGMGMIGGTVAGAAGAQSRLEANNNRFLETDDEYFDYAPANVPPQGRWRIYGINLPESVLRKVYNENAARELHISA